MRQSEINFEANLGLIGRENLFELELPGQVFTSGELEIIIANITDGFDAAVETIKHPRFNAFRYGAEIAPPEVVTAVPAGQNAVRLVDNPVLRKSVIVDFSDYAKAGSQNEKLSRLTIASRVYKTLLAQGARKLPDHDFSVPLWVFAYFYGYKDCVKHLYEP